MAPRTFSSGFFQGGTGGGIVDRYTSAMDASAVAIRRILSGASNERQRQDRDHPMVGIEMHAGEVLYGLINLGIAMYRPAILAIMSQGDSWVWDIRHFTPDGPTRPALAEKMHGRGDYAERMPFLPSQAMSSRLWRREAQMALREVGKAGKSHLGGSGARFAADHAWLEKARGLLSEPVSDARIKKIWGGEDLGSLRSSIAVRATIGGGVGELTAYSNNFYAGYVNDGFDHGLVPIIRTTRRDGKLSNPRNKVWAVLSIGWLGDYDIWSHERWATSNGQATGQVEAFSFIGKEVGKAQAGDTLGAGSVAFAKRNDPTASVKITARKHQEGIHFFEKGTTEWLGSVLPRWRTDIDNIIRQAFYEGKSHHQIAALYAKRVAKGKTGGNRPGTFA